MKKHLLFILATLLPLVASAQTKVEIDGIWYNLTAETREAEVTFKGDNPFLGNDYSGSITLPATVTYGGVAYSVTSIGNGAFTGCYSLTAITLPEGVTSIGEGAFEDCSSLTAITIPEGVTSIGDWAFYGCSALKSITCKAVTPPTIENKYTFKEVEKSIPVYVPAGSVEAYKEAQYWSDFTNIIGIEAGIENSEIRNENSTIIYDLHGRRVAHPTKSGIYIVGGKKVVIK